MPKSKTGSKDGFVVQNRRKGFGMIGNDFIDLYGPVVGAYGIAAYCILVRFASATGEDAKPSYNKVAALMKTSRPTAIKAIKHLVSLKLIAKEKRIVMGESATNVYSILDVPDLTEEGGLRKNLQEVGGKPGLPPSQPGLPPSQPGLPPSQPGLPPSQPGLPDQYTITNTPLPIHHSNIDDDDDDAWSFSFVKANGRARADQATRTATQPADPALVALRSLTIEMVDASVGLPNWDDFDNWLALRTPDELHLACLWCQRHDECIEQDLDAIHNPVAFIRSGVEGGRRPGLRPASENRVTTLINLRIDLAQKGQP